MIPSHTNWLYGYSITLAREAERLIPELEEKCPHTYFSSIRVKICNIKEPKRKEVEVKVQCILCESKFPKTQEIIKKKFDELNKAAG